MEDETLYSHMPETYLYRYNGVDHYAVSNRMPCGCGRGMRRKTLLRWMRRGSCACGRNRVTCIGMRPTHGVFYSAGGFDILPIGLRLY